ncbi:hypothetical protein ALI22I_13765 [Saccharothrix sp. ALI-22-I]|uniref:tetratricopeptide repeat protein n=1 Tax=Saccharothrix sp. ALI-22-I TaxID=1933778 RepID=UPI00097BE733|nr:tetratricopeptide repeat protein [Saccharothrix sp. ALI-22-I]ONI89983.1 hypothetical protein ALI22I_13765 [Saccharothrix sp. ALI-22-I]
MFALLGIAPGPDIGLPAAASLTGLPEVQVRQALRVLEEHSLLDRHPHGRYAMHDLVRAYAATTAHDLAEPVRQAALARVVDFYLHTAAGADHLVDPHGTAVQLDPPVPGCHPQSLADAAVALVWFETEHRCLLAAQRTAAAQRWHGVVVNMAWVLVTFHRRRGHRHDQLAVWLAALTAAQCLPDPVIRTRVHRFVGASYADLGRHDEAIEHLQRALGVAEQHGDPTQRANSHYHLAWAWERQGDARRALDHATHALSLYRILRQPEWEARMLNSVGWLSTQLGDYDSARQHCEAALALYRHHHSREGEADRLDSLGLIDHHTGHHQHAIDHYQQSLAPAT